MRDVIVIAANILIPVSVFVLWLVAEFRFGRGVRLALGLALTLLLLSQVWITASVGEQVIDLHRIGLSQIERRLDDGGEESVRRVLKAYHDTYEKTKSSQAAVFEMTAVLLGNGPGMPSE